MYIYSENIRQYVIDNVTLKNKSTIDSEDLENIIHKFWRFGR